MTYTEYVQNYLEQQGQGTPIYTGELADAVAADYGIDKKKAAAATAVAVKRIMDKGKLPDLRCYQKGIYYRTVVTPFGEMGISREKLIANKYLLPDNGYETGLRLLHHMGLTTQMPTEHLLATNAAKDCVRYDSRLGVSICPPKAPVNAENWMPWIFWIRPLSMRRIPTRSLPSISGRTGCNTKRFCTMQTDTTIEKRSSGLRIRQAKRR